MSRLAEWKARRSLSPPLPSAPGEGVAMVDRTGERRRLAALSIAAAVTFLGAAAYLVALGGWYEAEPLDPPPAAADPAGLERLERRIAAQAPRGIYLAVDTHANRLRVYRGGELLREAICSTGSGTVLKDPESGREWVFDTPLGERRVQRKVKDPVWVKPDWAFIEEGFQPPKTARERVDDFSLGDYGLYLGDGYIIHGTIFQTLLGRRVTHGCVRLGDEDLEWVYWRVSVGSRVYLY